VSTVPVIYSPPVQRQSIPWSGRLLALGIALAALTVLVIGVTLKPAPAGVGTHRAMGFHQCDFLARTGLPCPSCGMTTSFAHFVRGQWPASLYVQPMGFVLALACGGVFWAGVYMALTASPLHRLVRQVPAVPAIMTILGFAIAAWAWKMFIHLKGIGGWQ